MYTWQADFGGQVILAPCLQQLCREVAASAKYGPFLTNLGEIGDRVHMGQGFGSDHNPFIQHNGVYYVRAVDFGVTDPAHYPLLEELRAYLQGLMDRGDNRLAPYGFLQKDGVASNWPPPGTHSSDKDFGHLHVSVTQANGFNPSPSGYVPQLDDQRGWGIDAPLHGTREDDLFMSLTPAEEQLVLLAAKQYLTTLSKENLQADHNRIVVMSAAEAKQGAQLAAIQDALSKLVKQ